MGSVDRREKAVVRDIFTRQKMLAAFVEQVDQTYRRRDPEQRFYGTGSSEGVPDLLFSTAGFYVPVEVKAPEERDSEGRIRRRAGVMSDKQKAAAQLRAMFGVATEVVHSFEEAREVCAKYRVMADRIAMLEEVYRSFSQGHDSSPPPRIWTPGQR